MKQVLYILILMLNSFVYGQIVNEDNINIRMELCPVIELYQMSNSTLRVANTENIVINYCNKYFELTPGVRLVDVNLDKDCYIIVKLSKNYNLGSLSKKSKVISNGIKTIDYVTNKILNSEDYIEYTIIDKLIE